VSQLLQNSQRRWWALGAVSLAVVVVGIDGTVLSVALPTLALKLHASESDLQWFSSAYLLVLAAAMLPAAVIGDRFGRKRLLLISLAAFGCGSVACAFSTSSAEFIAARVLLGAAGAGVIVMALAALTVLFSEAERPKAIGVWSAANFIALPIGPIIGGWLLSHAWWGWVFLMNVPVAVLGLLAAQALIPQSRSERRRRLDRTGILTSVLGVLGLTYGLIEAGQHGWGSGSAVAAIASGIVVLVGFFFWERRLGRSAGGAPLVDPELFRSRSYTWGVLLIAVLVLALMGVMFTMPQYFQGVVGSSPMGSGVRLLALVGGLIAGALPAERFARVLGAKLTVAAGFALISAGLLLGSGSEVGSSAGFVAGWMAVVGAGMGIAMATASSSALSELDEERGAMGSAVLQAVNKTGGPLGTAILGSVLSSGYLAHLQLRGLPVAAAQAVRQSVFGAVAVGERLHSPALIRSARGAFVYGMDRSLTVSAAIGVAGVVLALMFLPRSTSAERPADEVSVENDGIVVGG
jgi:DHA2 family multidrug resistance protein-like MFS transporter